MHSAKFLICWSFRSREYEPIECTWRSDGIIYFGSSSLFCCKFIFSYLVFFARNVCILFARNIFIPFPAQTKLRTCCRIVKVKGESTDSDDTSREQVLILLKLMDLLKGITSPQTKLWRKFHLLKCVRNLEVTWICITKYWNRRHKSNPYS